MTPGLDPLRRRNHFVPASYLAGFTESRSRTGTLTVYERTRGAPERSLRPSDVAISRDLYVRDSGDGELTDQIERWLAEHVEGPFVPVRDRLAFGADVGLLPSASALSRDDIQVVARFAAFQMLRTPEEREATRWIGEWSSYAHVSEQLEPEGELRQYFEDLRGSEFTGREIGTLHATLLGLSAIRRQAEDWLPRTVRIAGRLATALERMRWRVVPAPAGLKFVTCDMPFVCVRRGAAPHSYSLGAAVGDAGFEATLALSPKYALYVTAADPGESYTTSPEFRASVRDRTIRYARRWVYSYERDEAVGRLLQTTPMPLYYAQVGGRIFRMSDPPGDAYREAMQRLARTGERTMAFRYGLPTIER